MGKSADAFRTISEVAEWLGVPTHVLRFWESKFIQVKPVKRAGGRRYYRPGDMLLLGGIKKLLHDDGMTIKGVQKIMRKDGIGPVAEHSQPLDDLTAAEFSESEKEAPTAGSKPSPGQVAEFKSESPKLPDHPQSEETPAATPGGAAETPPPPSPAPASEPQSIAEAADVAAPEPEPAQKDPVARAPDAAPPEQPPEKPTETAPAPSGPAPSPPPQPEPEPAPAPAQVSVPADPDDSITAEPGLLMLATKIPRPLPPQLAAGLAPVIARLHKISCTASPSGKNQA